MLKIYNSRTKQKETFKPIKAGEVNVYVCGITVYDYCHIGHARAYLCFDTIIRYLRARKFHVFYVRNITDIDDKIINRAHENNEPWDGLSERFIVEMHKDFKALNLLEADKEPKATDHIPEMLQMIQTLIAKGHAYALNNGDVFYSVRSFEQYGQVSGRDIDKLRSGARVDILEDKQDPLDFALWKSVKPGEPYWESPWGKGRPGWHVECSVMSMKYLGKTFDIHGGGNDLKFPHHENECAQSEATTGQTFVNYWMHIGFLQVNQEKMSKSLGNFFTIRDVLEQYHPEVLRYFMISSHYRSPVEYSPENLEIAKTAMGRLYNALRGLSPSDAPEGSRFEEKFNAAMDDDFNTSIALSVLFDLARALNSVKAADPEHANALAGLLKQLSNHLGLCFANPEEFLRNNIKEDFTKIEEILHRRDAARKAKDWDRADAFRDELGQLGVILEDTPAGTLWRQK